jgi:hypothetical protein
LKSLRGRLQADKDSHQDEIVGIQENYNKKIKSLMNENKIECETLKEKISELEEDLVRSREKLIVNETKTTAKSADNMWNESQIDLTEEADEENFEQQLKKKNEEIVQLQYQVINQIPLLVPRKGN